jgi:hypothetical protein
MHCQQELSGFNLATPDARHRRPLKFLQSTLFFSIFSGNRDARFHRNLRNAMLGWLPLDAFAPSAANLRDEPPLQVQETLLAFHRCERQTSFRRLDAHQ